jgi:hypothetical protein
VPLALGLQLLVLEVEIQKHSSYNLQLLAPKVESQEHRAIKFFFSL